MLKKHVILYILLIIPVLYLITLYNYDYHWDGVTYAWNIENKPIETLFHKHHLIYTPFCKLIFLLITKPGINIRAIDMLIWINILSGIVFLYLCFMIFRNIFRESRYAAPIGTFIIALSYSFGTQFRNASPYIITLSLCTLVIYRATRNFYKDNRFSINLLDWFLLLLAVLFHQLAILMLPTLIYIQLYSSETKCIKTIFRNLSLFLFTLFGIYLITFFITNETTSITSFIKWASGYATQRFWVFKEAKGFLPTIGLSLYEGIMSNKALFLAPVQRSTLRLEEHVIYDGDPFFGNLVSWIIFIIFIWFIFDGFHKMAHDNRLVRFERLFIFWILPYLVFLQFYTPYISFYRLFYILPLTIALIYRVKSLIRNLNNLVFAAVVIIGFVSINYIFGYIPENIYLNNRYLVSSYEIKKYSTKNDLFIFPSSTDYADGIYVRYFGERDISFFRQFKEPQLGNLSNEKIKEVCESTKNWFSSNYENIYVAQTREISWQGFLIFSPPKLNREEYPEILLLNQNQISLDYNIKYGDKAFRKIEIRNHAY